VRADARMIINYSSTVELHPCIHYSLYYLLFLRCGSIQSQCLTHFTLRLHSRTYSLPYTIWAVSLPLTTHHATKLSQRFVWLIAYSLIAFFGLISSVFTPTPHRVPVRTGYTEFVLSQHKTHFTARAVKRCRFIHTTLEQTYFILHFRISQIHYKFVTSNLQTHVQKRIQFAICINVVLFIQYERMHNPPAYTD